MISAAEAYEIAVKNDLTERQIGEVEECIRKAASNGCFSCIYPGRLTTKAQSIVLTAEYGINTKIENGKYYTEIDWGI